MAKVTKSMLIGEIIRINEGVIPILLNSGMHCVGCPSAQGESLEEAAMVQGLEASKLVDTVNENLAKK